MFGTQNTGTVDSPADHQAPAPSPSFHRPLPMHPIRLARVEQNSCAGYSYTIKNGVLTYGSPEPLAAVEKSRETPVKTESADMDVEAAGNTSAVDTTSGVAKSTAEPPNMKRLSIMHQKIWAMKLKMEAADPEGAARARAARAERRRSREAYEASVKAEIERLAAARSADASADANGSSSSNSGGSSSGVGESADTLAFYDERSWEAKWWACHSDRCT